MDILQDQDIEAEGWLNEWNPERIEAEKIKNYRAREQFWLSKIEELNTWPLLFICGADHFDLFAALLLKEGMDVVKHFQTGSPVAKIFNKHRYLCFNAYSHP